MFDKGLKALVSAPNIPPLSTPPVKLSHWDTPGIIPALRRDYALGYSFSGIAKSLSHEFGITISRNSIAAKTFRMGLIRRVIERAELISLADESQNLRDDDISVPTERKTLVEVQLGECHWPYGDTRIKFCCRPIDKASIFHPYCSEHRKISIKGYGKQPGVSKTGRKG